MVHSKIKVYRARELVLAKHTHTHTHTERERERERESQRWAIIFKKRRNDTTLVYIIEQNLALKVLLDCCIYCNHNKYNCSTIP